MVVQLHLIRSGSSGSQAAADILHAAAPTAANMQLVVVLNGFAGGVIVQLHLSSSGISHLSVSGYC